MRELDNYCNKKDNSFLSPPATRINFTKNLHQTPACKYRGKYKERGKTDNIKKMGSSKIKGNRNQKKRKRLKETAKRNKKGDQGSPNKKKNIKSQDKEHENVLEDNLTEFNEYSKIYQMYRKKHILDLLNRFKDPTEARRR